MEQPDNDSKAAGAPSALNVGLGWQPIEAAPIDRWIWCFCSDIEPNYFAGKLKIVEESEEVLVSEKGNRRTYETQTTQNKQWTDDTPNWCATHWMELPEPPNNIFNKKNL